MLRMVVGLGNPGRRYQGTRHNAGFMVVEELRRRAGDPEETGKSGAARSTVRLGEQMVTLLRPMEYMNLSGGPVRAAMSRSGIDPSEVLVVSDDLWLPFGALRVRRSGSHGGHNGLRSIFESLGTNEIPRLRVGIGPAPEAEDQADYVLEPFTRAERERLDEVIGQAADCVETIARDGLTLAMNRYNRGASAVSEE